MIKKMHRACLAYPAWKSRHNPDWKPWSRPEQQSSTRVDLSKCKPKNYTQDVVDESQITETAEDAMEALENGDLNTEL